MDENFKNVIHSEFSFEMVHCVPNKRQQFVSMGGLQMFLCGLGSGKDIYRDFNILNRILR